MNRKWLIPAAGAVVIGAAILFVKGFWYAQSPKADISIGRVMLSEMEEQSVDEVQQKIQSVQGAREEAARAQREAEEAALREQHEAEAAALAAAEEEAKAAYYAEWCEGANALADADQFKSIFANSVVIGDSIVYGILETDLMLPTSVVCEIGGNVNNLMKYLPQVQALAPENIFLYVGFNDIGMNQSNFDQYYEDIVNFVTQIQALCPGVPMYMNEIIPVISTEFLECEDYWNSAQYNVILQRVCSEYGVTFIPTNDMVKLEFYYKDGYHMIRPFYPLWLRRMAEYAGLI